MRSGPLAHHASIAGAPGPSHVTEYWDDRFNEESPEELHDSEAEAISHAEDRFGHLIWNPGAPPR